MLKHLQPVAFPGSFRNLVGRKTSVFLNASIASAPLPLIVGRDVEPVLPSKGFQSHLGTQQLRFIFGSLQSIQASG